MLKFIITCCVAVCCLSPLISSDCYFAPYAGDRAAALSLTFDDGFRHQGKAHVSMLKPYGFYGTFFIVVGQCKDHKPPKEWGNRMSWQLLRELHAQGHEIANHSWSHAKLRKSLGHDALEKEINYAAEVFEQKMGFAPFSFAFPGGSRPQEVMDYVQKKHPMIRDKVLTYGGKRWTTEKANAWVDDAIAHKKWIVPMIHAISKGWSSFRSPKEFDEHLKYLKSKEDQIWIAPLGTVAKYQAAQKVAKIQAQFSSNKASINYQVPGLDPTAYNVPLTIVLAQLKAKQVSAVHQGKPLTTYQLNGKWCLDVPVLERSETVQVSWQ